MSTKNIWPKWQFTVEYGELKLRLADDFYKHLRQNFEGKKGVIVVRPYRKTRSSGKEDEDGNQNGYYWAVIVRMIAAELGMFDYEVHSMLTHMFLIVGKEINGRRFQTVRSTSDLSTVEFEEYCAKIRVWAGTPGEMLPRGFLIPLPNEVAWQEE